MNMKVHVPNWILGGSREQCCSLWRVLILMVISCYISSCAPQTKVGTPVFREEPQGQVVAPSDQTATLLTSADTAMQSGQLDKAEMHLERALRLSPRDAQIWHGMARVRFEQSNYAQAVQFCLKSNSLAGKNEAIIRQNWLLMEKAYLKTGDTEKAIWARQKASEK